MGAVAKLDVELFVEVTCETVHSRIRHVRAWSVPLDAFDIPDNDNVESDTEFDDELTHPDPLVDLVPTWAPADIGQALIDEWEASADSRAARPARVATIRRSSADNTAITCAAKLAIRSAS